MANFEYYSIEKIEQVKYAGLVYNFVVPGPECYVVNFACCHNCIHFVSPDELQIEGELPDKLWIGSADGKVALDELEGIERSIINRGGPKSGFTSEAGHRGIPGIRGGSMRGIGFMGDVERYSKYIETNPKYVNRVTAVSEIKKYASTLSESAIYSSSTNSLTVCEDGEGIWVAIEEYRPDMARSIPSDASLYGFYDAKTARIVCSLSMPDDIKEFEEGYSGRNFYHEFAHSLEKHVVSDGWEYALDKEWGGPGLDEFGNNNQFEAFGVAFADYMVQKRRGDLSWFEKESPITFNLFKNEFLF